MLNIGPAGSGWTRGECEEPPESLAVPRKGGKLGGREGGRREEKNGRRTTEFGRGRLLIVVGMVTVERGKERVVLLLVRVVQVVMLLLVMVVVVMLLLVVAIRPARRRGFEVGGGTSVRRGGKDGREREKGPCSLARSVLRLLLRRLLLVVLILKTSRRCKGWRRREKAVRAVKHPFMLLRVHSR